MMNIFLWLITGIILIFSFLKNKNKTILALQVALKKFTSILALFLIVMAGFAFLITYISAEFLQNNIGAESGLKGIWIAIGVGSISIMPGFAAFPLCAALHNEEIPYYIIAAFSIALMNVGVITFPIEKRFLGFSVALIRNALAIIVTIIAVVVVKLIFGE